MEYLMDGSSTKRIEEGENTYYIWKAIDKDGNVFCSFYGPMAFMACASFVKSMNNKTIDMKEAGIINMHSQEIIF